VNDADTVRSIEFIRRCSNTTARRAAVSPIRRQQSSIRRLPSDRKRGASIDPVGYDAGKKTKGVKRNAIVDTEGHFLSIEVIAANTQDRDCAAT
jgi:Transposase DDE domain